MSKPITYVLVSLIGVTSSSPALAQVCEPSTVQESLSYLRRLSLDLRGRLPSVEELESVVANGELDPSIVTAMLDSDELRAQMREHHTELLWANISDQRVANNQWNLISQGEARRDLIDRLWIRAAGRALRYRGAQVPCLDEPAQFDPMGEIITTPDATNPNIRREGWVEVEPYWAPGTLIKVCAFDAQTNATGTTERGGTVNCQRSTNSVQCGCGPSLNWCQSGPARTANRIIASMTEQMLRFTDGLLDETRPYTDIITGTSVEVNGPLVHYFRYQTGQSNNVLLSNPQTNYPLPDLGFDEVDRWETVERGALHAGVLSLPGYLAKFQSARGRANRFYNSFLCQHFEAPSEGLPPASDACNDEPNLTERCGCKHCHQTLEPAAAHWGRWVEAGISPLNVSEFPLYRADCDPRNGRVAGGCRPFYFSEAADTIHPDEVQYLGRLNSAVFADATREENIEGGPSMIAQEAVSSGAFAHCTASKMWQTLLGREPQLADEEAIASLAGELTSSGYQLKGLIQSIVTRPEYVFGERFQGEAQ